MIELKNVKKYYKSKKGNSTLALDDINLKIGSKQVVFIVGKSGSGKSTLLNLLGGLDSPTSGKILINGNNIVDFTKKQFDSYRNTYIGFVFQEFNILEQYNIYENIELAIKLQNRSTTRDKIDSLLSKLGIAGLGNRKVNELSGGQKQRVAIARALIKKPQIILADEPTGNLDRKSSEQIFNILKEIGKEQLVIVVSHDMESAKKYADRIIELEDGKIVNDSNNEDDFENKPIELKKSKLPFLYAFKMALINLKTKPFKLFMTVILTAISLIFMGFTVNCALFDRTMLLVNTMKDNDNYVYDVTKSDVDYLGNVNHKILDQNDIESIKKITNSEVNIAYSLYDNGNRLSFEYGDNDKNIGYYISGLYSFEFIELTDSRILGKIIGREPLKNNEIVVHKYFADYIIKFGIRLLDNTLYFPKSYDDLVNSNKIIKLGKNGVVITGIIDDDDSLFKTAKEKGTFETQELEQFFTNNYVSKASKIYVKGFTETAILESNKNSLLDSVVINDKSDNSVFSNIKSLNKKTSIITESGIASISSIPKDKIILSVDALRTFDINFDTKFNKYLKSNSGGLYDELLKEFISTYLKDDINSLKLNLYIYANGYSNDKNVPIKILGVSLDDSNYISHKYIEEYNPVLKDTVSVRIFDDNVSNLTNTFGKILFEDFIDTDTVKPGTYYSYKVDIDNNYDISNVMHIYKYLTIYILIISLVFVLFTFLLFSNFISVSISYCKKEVGILRALGATSLDVIKIFGYESLIIGLLSWFISIIGWFNVCRILNKSLFGNLYYTLNGIVTHPLVPIIMLLYTLAIALFITVVSIKRITNIKPIDAILNK